MIRSLSKLPRSPIDADDCIVANILCLKCGTSLRSLRFTERCPSCGHPASDSVHGDFLVDSDQSAVRQMANSADIILKAAYVLCALVLLGMLTALISARNLPDAVGSLFDFMLAGAVFSVIPSVLGIMILTRRRTLLYYRARFINKPTLVWLGPFAGVVLVVAVWMAIMYARILLDSIIVIGYLIPLGFFLWGLERLMRRVPNAQLATQSRLLWIGILIHGVICFAVRQMVWFIADDKEMATLLLSFSGVAVLIGMVLAGFTIQLLRAVEGALRNAAR